MKKDQLSDCILNGLDTSWIPDIKIPNHLDASWIPDFKQGADSILPDTLANKLSMDGLSGLSAQASNLAKDFSGRFLDYVLLAEEESLSLCIDQLMEEAVALGAILQDFGATTMKIEVEKSYQDERDNADINKMENVEVTEDEENELIEEETENEKPVKTDIPVQENPKIQMTQNQGFEEREAGSLTKNTEEKQKSLNIIEATVVNAINQNSAEKNSQEEKPVLTEVKPVSVPVPSSDLH